MDIRHAFVNSIQKQLLDKTHNGCILSLCFVTHGQVKGLLFILCIGFPIRGFFQKDIINPRSGICNKLNRAHQLVGFHEYRHHLPTGIELDIFHRFKIGRVGHRQVQRLTAFGQGQNEITAHQFFIDAIHQNRIQLHRIQIQHRHPVTPGQIGHQTGRRHQIFLDGMEQYRHLRQSGFLLNRHPLIFVERA